MAIKTVRPVAVIAVIILLAGCATLSESECHTADWHLIGYEDGARGQPVSHIGEHRKACAEYGVVPDYTSYRQGHAEGVAEYCTAARGFQLGKQGGRYNGVCPAELEDDFLHGYELGQEHHAILSDIDHYHSLINRSDKKIHKLVKRVKEAEKLVISDETTEKRRAELLEEIKAYQQKIGELEAKIDEYQRLKVIREVEYEQLPQPDFY